MIPNNIKVFFAKTQMKFAIETQHKSILSLSIQKWLDIFEKMNQKEKLYWISLYNQENKG